MNTISEKYGLYDTQLRSLFSKLFPTFARHDIDYEKQINQIISGGNKDQSLLDWAREKVTFSKIPNFLNEKFPLNSQKVLEELVMALGNHMEGWMYQQLSRYAVRRTIEGYGRKIIEDRGDSNPSYGKLSYDLGLSPPQQHQDTTQHEAEGRYIAAVNHALDEEGNFYWNYFAPDALDAGQSKEDPIHTPISAYTQTHLGEELTNVDQSTRRTVYAGGHFVARQYFEETPVNPYDEIMNSDSDLENEPDKAA